MSAEKLDCPAEGIVLDRSEIQFPTPLFIQRICSPFRVVEFTRNGYNLRLESINAFCTQVSEISNGYHKFTEIDHYAHRENVMHIKETISMPQFTEEIIREHFLSLKKDAISVSGGDGKITPTQDLRTFVHSFHNLRVAIDSFVPQKS